MMNYELAACNRFNVYPDSAYTVYVTCALIVFRNKETSTQQVVALKLPSAVTVIKCPGHRETDSLTAK